jgi:hypothetical protein
MEWMTAVAPSRCCVYEAGSMTSPFCQETDVDQSGALADDVTEDQLGTPERLMEVTAQPRWAAALQMRLPGGESVCVFHRIHQRHVPRKPLPPQTTSFFFAAEAIVWVVVGVR